VIADHVVTVGEQSNTRSHGSGGADQGVLHHSHWNGRSFLPNALPITLLRNANVSPEQLAVGGRQRRRQSKSGMSHRPSTQPITQNRGGVGAKDL
jgi:hypothetical protein